jgi:hypothetical protein
VDREAVIEAQRPSRSLAAVAVAPNFADACFNLALTCEELELVDEAQRYWRRYLDLDPMGEWAAIAREHLDGASR